MHLYYLIVLVVMLPVLFVPGWKSLIVMTVIYATILGFFFLGLAPRPSSAVGNMVSALLLDVVVAGFWTLVFLVGTKAALLKWGRAEAKREADPPPPSPNP